MGCHFLLQGIFLTRGSNLHLLPWPADFRPVSHEGRPQDTGVKRKGNAPPSPAPTSSQKAAVHSRLFGCVGILSGRRRRKCQYTYVSSLLQRTQEGLQHTAFCPFALLGRKASWNSSWEVSACGCRLPLPQGWAPEVFLFCLLTLTACCLQLPCVFMPACWTPLPGHPAKKACAILHPTRQCSGCIHLPPAPAKVIIKLVFFFFFFLPAW